MYSGLAVRVLILPCLMLNVVNAEGKRKMAR
jgi:hypothetical protein